MAVYDVGYKRYVRELYESLGVGYIGLYLLESVREYMRLFEACNPRGRRVLDVGCGVGVGAGLASGIAGVYICLDIACGVLRYSKAFPYVDVICADGEFLPIRKGSVDLVVLINVVNADGDGLGLLKEAMRLGAYIYAISPREVDRELIRKALSTYDKAINVL